MSSSDGAGSVEQMATGCLPSAARRCTARAAETVVLPTPPLPMLKESGVGRIGQPTFWSLILLPELFGGMPRGGFLPANTCCVNRSSDSEPKMGVPPSCAILRRTEKCFLMNERADSVWRAVCEHRAHALAA